MNQEIKKLESKLTLTKVLNDIVVNDNESEKRDLILRMVNFLLDLGNPDVSFTLFTKRTGLGYTIINTINPVDVRMCGLIKYLKEREASGGCKSMWTSGLTGRENFTKEEYAAEVEKLKELDALEKKKYNTKVEYEYDGYSAPSDTDESSDT